jgi:Arc/MetJ-type ribon-helix-helix transcriptional regulator
MPAIDLEDYVQRKISSGAFRSRDEFAWEAIRIYREFEEQSAAFQAEVRRRVEQAGRGDVVPWDIDAIKAELRDTLDTRGQAQSCPESSAPTTPDKIS